MWKQLALEAFKKANSPGSCLQNALIPVITILGLTFASLLGGAVLTEVTFSGLDWQIDCMKQSRCEITPRCRELWCFGSIVVIASILIDLLNAYIDPRIRY